MVQLSIGLTQRAEFHSETAKRLTPLRDKGILVIGSGNLVHNLYAYAWGPSTGGAVRLGGALLKNERGTNARRDHETLIACEKLGIDAILSVPTPDHYLPLLYVIAQMRAAEPVSFPVGRM